VSARVRTCVGCARRDEPVGWYRIAAVRDGAIGIGPVAPGRGAWVCSVGCFDRATARTGRSSLARALRREVSDHEVSTLRARLFG
jgi:predicted RNA-binding protein YlxR (DUF448 family)